MTKEKGKAIEIARRMVRMGAEASYNARKCDALDALDAIADAEKVIKYDGSWVAEESCCGGKIVYRKAVLVFISCKNFYAFNF